MSALIWIVVILIILIIASPYRLFSPRTLWYVQKLNGPKGWPFLGVGFDLAFLNQCDVLDYFKDIFKKYPRITAIWVLGVPTVFLQEPEDIEVVLGTTNNISKGIEYLPLLPWLKEGLLTSSGEKWHKRRKILTPSFHFRILEDSLPTMNKNASLFAQKLLNESGGSIEIDPFVKLCTLDVLCESIMGVTLGAQNDEGKTYVKAIKRMTEIIMQRELSFWLFRNWTFHLFPIGFEFRRVLKFLLKFTHNVIQERKKAFIPSNEELSGDNFSQKTKRAFLDTMIEYEANNPNSFNKEDIQEEVDTFMFEGHDTTTSAITFTLLLLGTHPHIQERVVAELFQIFGESDSSVEMKDLPKMVYLEKVIKESLRLFPSVPYISRTVTSDIKLESNIMIPAGANLAIMPYFLHRNSRFFPDPEKFDPDRFADRSTNKNIHPFAYIPFSAGPRNCIGQKFAMIEIKIVLSTLLRKATIEAVTRIEDVKLLSTLVLRPHIPIKMRIIKRKSLQSAMRYY